MLVGREAERTLIDALLGNLRAGLGGELVLLGEGGIGKTALMDHARSRAGRMSVLAAQGIESEAELPFTGLGELLQPILAHLDHITEAQAAALRGALALGPPVDADRFLTFSAALSLLAVAAEHGPLLIVVDDLHWLDAASREALLFAMRRLASDPVALIAAARPGELEGEAWFRLRHVRLEGLGLAAAAELLRANEPSITGMVASQLHAATGGNPLALVEIPSLLSSDQLRGAEPLANPLPAGPMVQAAFRRQLGTLPAPTRRALLVGAVSESGSMADILPALAAQGLGVADLEPAEDQGLVLIESGQVRFRHPLLRSASHDLLGAEAQAEAHRALALSLPAGSEDSRAWHLAAAALEPDPVVADAVAEAGLRARQRGAYAAAARALERGARLTPDVEVRSQRFLQAAAAAYLGGRPSESLTLLAEALGSSIDPRRRAEIQHLWGRILMWSGHEAEATRLLTDGAQAVADLDPELAAMLLGDVVSACLFTPDARRGLRVARQTCLVAQGRGGICEASALMHLSHALAIRGRPVQARPLLQRRLAMSPEIDAAYVRQRRGEPRTWSWKGDNLTQVYANQLALLGQVSIWLGDHETARRLVAQAVNAARSTSALSTLSYPLHVLADLQFQTGHWAESLASLAESIRLCEELNHVSIWALGLTLEARIEAGRGHAERCRTLAALSVELGERHGFGVPRIRAPLALGFLELGRQRPAAALPHLDACARAARRAGVENPRVEPWQPERVEALVAMGRRAEANSALAELLRHAARTQGTWELAVAARCQGMLAEGEAGLDHFDRALSLHRRIDAPFEEARTRLCLGEALLARQRGEAARAPLRTAFEAFGRVGAEPWADRARARLRMAGGTVAGSVVRTADLTPQELQVALLVAEGATNKEAAARLFLSPKTIETHLSGVYSKLSLRSRTELAHLLAREGVGVTSRS